jgi:hypothetical protein
MESGREAAVKKTLALLLALGACRNPPPGTSLTGAAAPRLAVDQFMTAVKAQDLQAMSVVWGTAEGAARDQMPRAELDQRLIVIQGCYTHDRYQIVEETPGTDGKRFVKVSITRARRTKTPNFSLVKGPSDRWYVLDADFATMRDMCRSSGS